MATTKLALPDMEVEMPVMKAKLVVDTGSTDTCSSTTTRRTRVIEDDCEDVHRRVPAEKSHFSGILGILILIVALSGLTCAIIALCIGSKSSDLAEIKTTLAPIATDTRATGAALPTLVTKSDFGHTRLNAFRAVGAAQAATIEAHNASLAAARAATASESVVAELPKLAHRSDLFAIIAAAQAAERAAKAVPATDVSGLATKEFVTTETDRHTQYMERLLALQRGGTVTVVETEE